MYRLSAKAGSKGQGASASSHADYILREGKYSSREDLQESGYGNMPNFVGSDPREFWKLSDLNEGENRTVYREIELALPLESTKEQRKELVEEFAKKNLDGYAFTYAVHDVKGNPHSHIMFCDRKHDNVEREPEQFFKRANKKEPAKGGCAKAEEWIGKDRSTHIEKVRESWAKIENAHFKRIGSAERVDHRTLVAQREDALFDIKNAGAIDLSGQRLNDRIKTAALLDRPADQRVSSRRWKLMQRTGEIEEIRESRKANRELAQAKAALVDLQVEKEKREVKIKLPPTPQDIVAQPAPPKSAPVLWPEIKVEKIQEVIQTPDATRSEDLRPPQGEVVTTISSAVVQKPEYVKPSPVLPIKPVPVVVTVSSSTQSEALPPETKTNPPIPQPAFDLPAAPALTAAELAYHAVLRRIAAISQNFIALYNSLVKGDLLGGEEKYNDRTDRLEAELRTILKPYPGTTVNLPYDDTPIIINGQPITEIVKTLPPEPKPDQKPSPAPTQGITRTGGRK